MDWQRVFILYNALIYCWCAFFFGSFISEEIIAAVDCLTRRPEESHEQFINPIRGNNLARRVKILDLEDNTDLSRIDSPTHEDRLRLEKYKRTLDILQINRSETHNNGGASSPSVLRSPRFPPPSTMYV